MKIQTIENLLHKLESERRDITIKLVNPDGKVDDVLVPYEGNKNATDIGAIEVYIQEKPGNEYYTELYSDTLYTYEIVM